MSNSFASPQYYLGKSWDETLEKLVTVDSVHYEVHEGEMFLAEHSASVLNAADLELLVVTGAKQYHSVFGIAAGGQVTLYFFEGTTKTGGTGITPRNLNRNKSDNTDVVVTHTPGGAGDGTAIVNGRLLPGGATNQTRVGGSARSNSEIILRPNTSYLVRVTNTSGGTIVINPAISYYGE